MATAADPGATAPLVRVERGGRLTDDELAALTVVLLSRGAAPRADGEDRRAARTAPRWERPERHVPYRPAGSWHGGARPQS
ncbi:acyl-CoA carboxylase subunit epsilon [Streptomyces fuscigenes]|uniref:acyl-CoA carboxylase subunit epsilon n=1 Tax=Streptomyces fuscigenes TaxID=1528880 RepID=UPI001F2BC074|nr:acyl-CoA carboxylase subunit epsilon [Streptomyces fuscigenes]MCF3960680.1 acyl-CoA carboxylase subunit epsilon [Streptomyces fuscigenes]